MKLNKIKKYLSKFGTVLYPDIFLFNELTSTNDYSKQLQTFKDGTVIIAKRQTCGRGTNGKSFVSDAGGLYMSIVFKPRCNNPLLYTSAAAVIVESAIEKACGKNVVIKWVNDLYYNDKKVCGILAENCLGADGKTEKIVIGIGINLLPYPSLPDTATALFDKNEKPDAEKLAASIINEFLNFDFNSDFLPHYKEKCFILGHEITVLDNPPYAAKAVDITKDCGLIINSGGKEKILYSGEVSVKI